MGPPTRYLLNIRRNTASIMRLDLVRVKKLFALNRGQSKLSLLFNQVSTADAATAVVMMLLKL